MNGPPLASHAPRGLHVLADLHGVDAGRASDPAYLATLARECAELAGARVLEVAVHGFGTGAGVAGVALLAESHLSFHTWPEHGFAALDAFMCGDCNPERALRRFARGLAAQRLELRHLQRGR